MKSKLQRTDRNRGAPKNAGLRHHHGEPNSGIKGLIEGIRQNGVMFCPDVLSQLGSMFIRAGMSGTKASFRQCLCALVNGKANGGPVNACRGHEPWLVGERGPEIMVPDSSLPRSGQLNEASRAAMSRYSGIILWVAAVLKPFISNQK